MIEGQFRDDLDVSGIVISYKDLAEPVKPGEEFSPEDAVEIKAQYEEITQDPQRFGNGPLLASSDVSLVPTYPPLVCWDVNGYYRALGVHFLATRKELRQAYMAVNGQNSEYLTFVLTKLLDPEVRRVYDLLPLGSLYMDDKYVQERIKRAAFAESARRTRMGFETTPQAILIEWGFQQEEKEFSERSETELDLSEDSVILNEWVYSYFLWRSAPQEHQLREWQTLLIRELSALGIVTTFAVGLIGGEGHLYLKVDNDHVFFIDTSTNPTQQMAALAAKSLKEQNGF